MAVTEAVGVLGGVDVVEEVGVDDGVVCGVVVAGGDVSEVWGEVVDSADVGAGEDFVDAGEGGVGFSWCGFFSFWLVEGARRRGKRDQLKDAYKGESSRGLRA